MSNGEQTTTRDEATALVRETDLILQEYDPQYPRLTISQGSPEPVSPETEVLIPYLRESLTIVKAFPREETRRTGYMGQYLPDPFQKVLDQLYCYGKETASRMKPPERIPDRIPG